MPVYEYSINLKNGVSTPAKQAAESVRGLSGDMGGLQAELAAATGGLSVVVEALGAVAVAFGGAVIAGAAMAIEANEAKAKMTSLFDALGEGKISGAETIGMLDQLSDKIGITRKELAPITQDFLTMGITGKAQLEGLTTAVAGLNQITPTAGAAFTKLYGQVNAAAETGSKLKIPYKKLEGQLKDMGLNIDDLSRKMGKSPAELTRALKAGTIDAKAFGDALTAAATDKGAGPLARAGASLGNVWAKFQENIGKIFEDIDVGPFLEQVKDLFNIFGQANPSGQALKAGIGGFFKEVFASATKVVPVVKHFLLDLVIYGLKGYIALKPVSKWFQDMLKNQTVMKVLTMAVKGFVGVLIAVGAAIAVVVGLVAAFWAGGMALMAGIYALSGAIMSFVTGAAETMTKWLQSAGSLASDFIAGLVSGIGNGVSSVVSAVKGLADKAKGAFKSALGISSPSKVMMEMGNFAGQGVAEGMTAAAPDVHGAATSLGGVAADGAASGMSSGGGGASSAPGGRGGVIVNVESGAIQINGAGKSAEELTESMLALVFERVALAQGLG